MRIFGNARDRFWDAVWAADLKRRHKKSFPEDDLKKLEARRDKCGKIGRIPGRLMVLAGLATLGLEIYYWLRWGTFSPTKTWLVANLTCCTPFYHWLVAPEDWLGAHRIASFLLDIPLFLSLIVCGLLASAMGYSSATEELDKRISQLRTEQRRAVRTGDRAVF